MMVNEKQTERQDEHPLVLAVRPKDFIGRGRNQNQLRQLIVPLSWALVTTLVMASLTTFLFDLALSLSFMSAVEHLVISRMLAGLTSILIILFGVFLIIGWTSKRQVRRREIALTRLRQKEERFLAQVQADLDKLINRRTT